MGEARRKREYLTAWAARQERRYGRVRYKRTSLTWLQALFLDVHEQWPDDNPPLSKRMWARAAELDGPETWPDWMRTAAQGGSNG